MDGTDEFLVHIDAPHFRAGVVIRDGVVVRAADILAWMIGRSGVFVSAYCSRKNWRAFTVPSANESS